MIRTFLLPWAVPFVVAMALVSCSTGIDPRKDDTPTFGHVLLLADEDLRPMVEAERIVFEGIYHEATLDIRYLSEADLLKAMANDSVRCVITTAAPGADQEAYFRTRQLSAPSVPVWTDGIAVVANKAFPADHLTTDNIRAWLQGTAEDEYMMPLFPGHGSGVARTLVDSLHLTGLRAQALPNVDSVVVQVARDPGAIGLLPFTAISDLDDPHMRHLREQVKLLAVSGADSSKAVLPSQSTLADGQYPLRRTVNIWVAEGKSGLGTGFVSFVANHKGQRIILKRGLAPIKVPAREVEIVHQ